MSELRRWSEEGATASELALVKASRRERPQRSARARTLGALGVGLSALASMTTTTAAGGAAVLTKVVGVTLLLGGVTVGGIVWQSRAHLPNTGPTSGAASRPPKAVAVGTATAAGPRAAPLPSAITETAPPLPKAVPRGPRSASPRIPSGTLSLEVAALEHVRDALAARDFEAALGALDRYQARFPGGELAPEATVLRVEALLGRGDRGLAAATADEFAAAHPESPYASRMQRLVRDEQRH